MPKDERESGPLDMKLDWVTSSSYGTYLLNGDLLGCQTQGGADLFLGGKYLDLVLLCLYMVHPVESMPRQVLNKTGFLPWLFACVSTCLCTKTPLLLFYNIFK